jgi:AcrR family transcriptional regulator
MSNYSHFHSHLPIMTAASSQIIVSPRKKPLQSRSRATVEAVLAAAAHILEDRGLTGFNTNAVAERAGVSIGSLYQYFPSKDAILVALMEQSLTLFSETLSEAIDGAPGDCLGEDLKFWLQMGLVSHLRRPNLVRLLEGEFQRLETHINKTSSHVAVRAAMIRLLSRYGNQVRIDDLQVAAQDMGAIAKALMGAAGERGEADWEAVIDRTVRAMLGYLGAEWDGPAASV